MKTMFICCNLNGWSWSNFRNDFFNDWNLFAYLYTIIFFELNTINTPSNSRHWTGDALRCAANGIDRVIFILHD